MLPHAEDSRPAVRLHTSVRPDGFCTEGLVRSLSHGLTTRRSSPRLLWLCNVVSACTHASTSTPNYASQARRLLRHSVASPGRCRHVLTSSTVRLLALSEISSCIRLANKMSSIFGLHSTISSHRRNTMHPALRAHETARRALSFFSSAVLPSLTWLRSTLRGATALTRWHTKTPEEIDASLSLLMAGSAPPPTLALAQSTTSFSVSCLWEREERNLITW
mmetsp:Transcript_80122/g.159257  ORF Transcript_80122/g.159257 Transcript_80122/m.159257 type:complete len:220 (-) Transcript_80122:1460-2119(-)